MIQVSTRQHRSVLPQYLKSRPDKIKQTDSSDLKSLDLRTLITKDKPKQTVRADNLSSKVNHKSWRKERDTTVYIFFFISQPVKFFPLNGSKASHPGGLASQSRLL